MDVAAQQAIKSDYDAGLQALKAGDFAEAGTAFGGVIKSYPEFYLAHYQLANLYLRESNFEEAEKSMDKVIELQPDWAEGFFGAGKIAMLQGVHDDAVGFFTEALKRGYKRRLCLIAKGMALHGCGRLAEAIDDFDEVLVEQVDLSALHYRMACLFGLHRYQEALSDLDVLLELQPEQDSQPLLEMRDICLQHANIPQSAPKGESIPITELK